MLFPDTINSPRTRERVQDVYKRTDLLHVVIACINTEAFRWQMERPWTDWWQAFPELNLLLLSTWMLTLFCSSTPKKLIDPKLCPVFYTW